MIEPRQAYVLKLLPPANDTAPAVVVKTLKTIGNIRSSMELVKSVLAMGRTKRLEKM